MTHIIFHPRRRLRQNLITHRANLPKICEHVFLCNVSLTQIVVECNLGSIRPRVSSSIVKSTVNFETLEWSLRRVDGSGTSLQRNSISRDLQSANISATID